MKRIIDRFIDNYYFLSNFYPEDVEYKGYIYPTSEHAFQAQKCSGMEVTLQRRKEIALFYI